ncbi:hypothetical protein Acsp01_54180 [Actinoplanes sp. NBRC 101535]|nr:hypothetical protein Acsp01_54180 [Actinoplanes sp. NBRC 101535]
MPAGARGVDQGLREFRNPVGGLPELPDTTKINEICFGSVPEAEASGPHIFINSATGPPFDTLLGG